MTPQTVNASYNPLRNEITFPAGILQPPFFHRDFPAAMNYGGIGAVIGHELSHGFDDQGRKFAADGQLREWWAAEVVGRYEERAACVEELYSSYEIEPGVKVLGKLTLGENVADLGGVKQSYRAFQSWIERHGRPEPAVDGLSPEQLFFVAYAQNWCSLSTPEDARLRATTDVHSPPRFRVIGPLSSFPAFGEAFQCPVGSPMRPKEVCEVW
jgi:endothelin-converting enzyme/putative endopeptidase